MNSNSKIPNDKQKTKPLFRQSIQKLEMDTSLDTASGDTKRDSSSPITKKQKINESGDSDDTLYLTCTEFDTSTPFIPANPANVPLESSYTVTALETSIATTSDVQIDSDTTFETAPEDSTLDSTITESGSNGTITNSSFDETLAETSWDNTLAQLTFNSSFRKRYSTKRSSNESLQNLDEDNTTISDVDITLDDFENSAYFSVDSSFTSNVPQSFKDLNKDVPPSDSSKIVWRLFTEYREQGFISSDTSTSFIYTDDSWIKDSTIASKDEEELAELEAMMSQLNLSGTELADEKELSLQVVENMNENEGDEYGPDVDTTNLLLLARQALESYAEVEEQYMKRAIRARKILRRRLHMTLEEFFRGFGDGVDIKEGLDRYENFFEEVEKAAVLRERCEKMKINLKRFEGTRPYKQAPRWYLFKTLDDMHVYFKTAKYSALHLHTAKVNKSLSQRRGYESI